MILRTLHVNVSPFQSLGYSIVRTIVMTIGEFDFESTFGQTNDSRNMLTSFPEAAYLLWIIFLIVMPILVTNLLVRK